jgi:hypothetical protein
MGYRAHTIPTLGLPDSMLLSVLRPGAAMALPGPSAIYGMLRRVGEESERILSNLPSVDVQIVAADIHTVPKFCERLNVMYTPHKASPCTCRAVEVIAEVSRKGIGKPLAMNPVKVVEEEKEKREDRPPAERKRTNVVAERLDGILSFVESKYGKKPLMEFDSEYTRSKESRKLLISTGWEFTTRIRKDSLIGRDVIGRMESKHLDIYGRWYETEDYGGRFQIVGRRIFPKLKGGGQRRSEIILYLSTRRLPARKVIEERSRRWRIENLFKNVDIDSTPGNDDSEIRGYYTLAFFMAELGIAFKASTKTIGLLLNREGSMAVSNGVMKIRLKNLDRRLLTKMREYVDYINAESKLKDASLSYKLMRR